jgi:nucleotide-binding universal stress UspA family protein
VAQEFASWCEAHGVGGVRHVLEFGAVPEALADLAARERAAVVVLGSRKLSAVERVFTTSTASALAGLCPCAVAVVPNER